jgi:hypothetical protein
MSKKDNNNNNKEKDAKRKQAFEKFLRDRNAAEKQGQNRDEEEGEEAADLDDILQLDNPAPTSATAVPPAAAAAQKQKPDLLESVLKQNYDLKAKLDAVEKAEQQKRRAQEEAEQKRQNEEKAKDLEYATQNFDRNEAVARIYEQMAKDQGTELTEGWKNAFIASLSSRSDTGKEFQVANVAAARGIRKLQKDNAAMRQERDLLAKERDEALQLLQLNDTVEEVGSSNKQRRTVEAARRGGGGGNRLMQPDPRNGQAAPEWLNEFVRQDYGATPAEMMTLANNMRHDEKRKVSAARKKDKSGPKLKGKPKVAGAAGKAPSAAARKKRAALRGEEEPLQDQEDDSGEDEFEGRAATMGRRQVPEYNPNYVGKPRSEKSMSNNPHSYQMFGHLRNVTPTTEFTHGAGYSLAGFDFGGEGGAY